MAETDEDDDIEWIDITTVGSSYDVEIAVNRENRYRHRRRFAHGRMTAAAWTPGPPPSREQ